MSMSPRLLRPRFKGGFTVKSISGLDAWWDSSDQTTVTLDASSNVSQWTDKSGNNRTLAQSTANNRPSYSGTINGRSVLTFDGLNDTLGTSGAYSQQQYSVFAVVKSTSSSGLRGVITADSGGGTTNTRGPQLAYTFGSTYGCVGFTAAGGVVTEAPATSVATNTARVITVVQTASALEMWINGSSNGGSTCSQTAYSQPLYVGVASHGVGSGSMSGWFAGDIAEVVVYGQALSDTQRASVQTYLTSKWGVA